jgi:hypothetical protein
LPDTREHILPPQVCSSKFYLAELVARILGLQKLGFPSSRK